MARSVAEIRELLEYSQFRKAIWERAIDLLGSHLDTEGREALKGISYSKDGPNAPQELIQEIIDEIQAEKVDPLEEEIDRLEHLPVVETTDGEESQQPDEPQRSQGKAKKNTKRVRIVSHGSRG